MEAYNKSTEKNWWSVERVIKEGVRIEKRTRSIKYTRSYQLFASIESPYGRRSGKENIMWRRDLLKNKLCACLFILVSMVPILIDQDGTLFIFSLMLGVPMFFAKKNWIV